MAKKRIAAFFVAFAAFTMCWAVASGGTASDPVASRSYLKDTFAPNILDQVAQAVSRKLSFPEESAAKIARAARGKISEEGVLDSAADVALEELQARGKFWYNAPNMQNISVKAGQVLSGAAGTKAILLSGSGVIYGNPVVNLTAGYEYPAGSKVSLNNSYFFTANDGSGIRFTADSTVGVSGSYKLLSAVRIPRYTDLAKALETMGLVRGAANGFELYRGATRAEAITMLIRLLAEENAAVGFSHPFKDVAEWANDIVGYAYKRGYANGTSPTTFGAASPTTVNHYMTFLLRALGYNDSAGDFSWDDSMNAAVRFGVITAEESAFISSTPFTRDHMVYLSYYALMSKMKDERITLLDSLVGRGAVSQSAADAAVSSVTRKRG